jgi:predicted outer membrane lipoprotein
MQSPESPTSQEVDTLRKRVNEALLRYSDKDLNYSRITLISKPLHDVDGPYALWYETLDVRTKVGKSTLKLAADEVAWGERHTNELGILEIISLRINKALMESTSDELWGFNRPIFRLEKKEVLAQKGINAALWYEVHEVAGEEFENR